MKLIYISSDNADIHSRFLHKVRVLSRTLGNTVLTGCPLNANKD